MWHAPEMVAGSSVGGSSPHLGPSLCSIQFNGGALPLQARTNNDGQKHCRPDDPNSTGTEEREREREREREAHQVASVTTSSDAVGWTAMHSSKSALVAPIRIATPNPCT